MEGDGASAEARSRMAESVGGVLGDGGSEPPPHQLEGLGERCKLPENMTFGATSNLRIHYRNAL